MSARSHILLSLLFLVIPYKELLTMFSMIGVFAVVRAVFAVMKKIYEGRAAYQKR